MRVSPVQARNFLRLQLMLLLPELLVVPLLLLSVLLVPLVFLFLLQPLPPLRLQLQR